MNLELIFSKYVSIFAGLIFAMNYFAIFIIINSLANFCKSQPIEYSELQCYESNGWQEPGYLPTNTVIRVIDLSKEGFLAKNQQHIEF